MLAARKIKPLLDIFMPKPARNFPDKFQVAFSLAGEERDLVRAVAEAVEKELGSPRTSS